jgi:uncharacterized protein
MKIKVLLDTNFLMIPGEYTVDIFSEISRLLSVPYDVCIFEETLSELSKIASSRKKDSGSAKIAIKLIKQKNLKRLENSLKNGSDYIDDIIINSITDGFVVCTQDKGLKKRIKAKFKDVKIITLKSKRYLGFD